MAFLDLFSGFWGEEEVSGSVRVKGAEDPAFRDAIPEESHALEGVFFIDKHHLINPVGSVVQKHQKVIKDPREVLDPLVGAAVEMKHHTDERFSWAADPVFVASACFIDLPGSL
jgi:hypothetical protein